MDALVTPQMLTWARTTAHLRPDEAAHKIGVPEGRITDWESGTTRPTMAQARKAATAYKRPLSVFYLDSPPKEFKVLQDYRRGSAFAGTLSPELAYVIRDIQERQAWVRQDLIAQGSMPLRFVGSLSLQTPVHKAADRIRRDLGFLASVRRSWRRPSDPLRTWERLVEQRGVYLVQDSLLGKLAAEEVRGFAVSDRYAPFIFVNPSDALNARVFSVLHELAHVWVGKDGISNLSGDKRGATGQSPQDAIETFCNRVASRVIVSDEELAELTGSSQERNLVIPAIPRIAESIGASRELVAVRLLEIGSITQSDYESLRELYASDRSGRKASGGSYYRNRVANLGRRYILQVESAFDSRRITGSEAASLIGGKFRHLSRLSSMARDGWGEH